MPYDDFTPWDCDTGTAIQRIGDLLGHHPDSVQNSFEFWFDLTEEGEARAAAAPDPFADDPQW
ncbi:hypothetical protein nbrc107697_01370 [Gordonia crocea]|uniref:Uncharacterized protein n=1 Tax=Gordonia crocea TaxID=589162 RepID=A0A7M3STX4_9ACTN|nr:hypothetical protein nbrc107697_01370 [Gordonia crocea]